MRCKSFLTKLSEFRGSVKQANEVCCALYHPSFKSNFSNIFRRAEISGNVRLIPSPSVGRILIDFVLTNHLIDTKWVWGKSVSALSNAAKVLGGSALAEKFWLDARLEPPLVNRGFSGEKYHTDNAFKRLAHAILLYEGYEAARDFIIKSIDPSQFISIFAEEIEFGDAKTLLQEFYQSHGVQPPRYTHSLVPDLPDHEPKFTVETVLPNLGRVSVIASSKAVGEMQAAELAILKLKSNSKSKACLYELFAKKTRSTKARHRRIAFDRVPPEIGSLSEKLEEEFGLKPELQGIFQALVPRRLGLISTGNYPDNDMASRSGALAIELALISVSPEFRSLGVEGAHPRLCSLVLEKFDLIKVGRQAFRHEEEYGVPVQRQIVQALVYSMFRSNETSFLSQMCSWVRAQPDLNAGDTKKHQGVKTPDRFFEEFSYVTVLQEFVARTSPILPVYTFSKSGPDNLPQHKAFCAYNGETTSGTSIRRTWAKNRAAFKMLARLGFTND